MNHNEDIFKYMYVYESVKIRLHEIPILINCSLTQFSGSFNTTKLPDSFLKKNQIHVLV